MVSGSRDLLTPQEAEECKASILANYDPRGYGTVATIHNDGDLFRKVYWSRSGSAGL
jgi:hypothetical protein